jgi:hypothetical protein
MKEKILLVLALSLFFSCEKKELTNKRTSVLSEKERSLLKDEILEDRFTNLLPKLMDDSEIDMWLLISREYNEDPVLKTMLPATWLNARRRTMIVFL